ncbi:hypothetical protein [Brevundimonas sp.]|uniref:hypothetical protein n=1 Tax=Brevundimonas sp. TaxID=1871086 RepID=UPI003D0C3BC9
MAIFREEFEKHRVPLETSLGVIKRHLVTMRGSAKQLVPLATLTGNFAQVRADVWRAASEILSEASDLDDRSLVKMKWLPPLSTSAANLEQAWEVVDDPSEADQTRRQAAQTCIAVLESFSATTRSNIESCVQAALVKRGWAFGKR